MNKRQARYKRGDRIGGRYLVHQALMGGMGEVYLCLDEEANYPYALKTFQGSSTDLADIFKDEVANWIALEKHPNIVACFWMQKFDNIPFMGLEWVAGKEGQGTDLRSWLRGGPLDLPLALRFTIDIVRGLIHANEKSPGIVHRDLKPDNVLVNQSRQAMITDFGLATVARIARLDAEEIDDANMGQSRYVGNIVGTPAYMPPEQWRGEADVDFRTDMYAVGCILYELLTGIWLYKARTISELRIQHLEASIPTFNGDLSADLRPLLDGCLAKRREDRFSRLDLLLADLTQLYEAHSDEPLPEVTTEAFTAGDYVNRGATFNNLGQHARAIEDFDQALSLDPNLALAYNNRGNSYNVLGQPARALEDFDQALSVDPNLALAYSNRGNNYNALGQPGRALEDFNRAIALDPNYAQAYNNRGNSYNALGQPGRALEDFNRAIALDPHYARAYNNRGGSYVALEQPGRALEDYNRAVTLNPTFANAYVGRGFNYIALEQHARAIEDFDQAIALDPNFAEAYIGRGNSYLALEQPGRALEDYNRAVTLDPTFANAYVGRGFNYIALEQAAQAIEDFDRAIALDPNFAGAYIGRGNSYLALEQDERAIQDFDRAIQLDPNLALAYVGRGNSYFALEQDERALEDYDRAIALDTHLPQAYFSKGGLLAITGQLKESLPFLEKAYALGLQQAMNSIQKVRQMIEEGK